MLTRYFSPKAVYIVTTLFERDHESAHDEMDTNNNLFGVEIGLSKKDIYTEVFNEVEKALISKKPHSKGLIILPKEHWTNGF